MDCFWAEIVSGSLHRLEAEDARWLGKDDMMSVDWLEADRGIAEKIAEELNKNKDADA